MNEYLPSLAGVAVMAIIFLIVMRKKKIWSKMRKNGGFWHVILAGACSGLIAIGLEVSCIFLAQEKSGPFAGSIIATIFFIVLMFWLIQKGGQKDTEVFGNGDEDANDNI